MITPFARTARGEIVHAADLMVGEITVRILTYGAILNDVRVAGIDRNLTTAPQDFSAYEGIACYHGALIGPVVNRLSDAAAPIKGQMHRFAPNEAGQTLLHSGAASTGGKVWQIDTAKDPPTETSVTLKLTLPDGEGGFPGTRHVTARYEVRDTATLRLTISASTDTPTLFNFANHSYWNLDGSATWEGHDLQIAANSYLPTTPLGTPTGETATVTGTDYDFRATYDFRTGHTPAPNAPPLDVNFCLSDAPQPLRDVLWLSGKSGLRMTLATTAPGLQVYDGRVPRLDGHEYYQALAIEAQAWPDAPNHPAFPQFEYGPDTRFHQITEWRFDRGCVARAKTGLSDTDNDATV